MVYSNGRRVDDPLDLDGFESSWGDLVSFYLGCSFSFESALNCIGVKISNPEHVVPVSMYLTNIPLKPVGGFKGQMYVSMRTMRKSQLVDIFNVTGKYPLAHGAPIHVGNPARIGVWDVYATNGGDLPVFDKEGEEVAVFWACGYSVSQILSDVGKES